jgi:hypothetical protein
MIWLLACCDQKFFFKCPPFIKSLSLLEHLSIKVLESGVPVTRVFGGEQMRYQRLFRLVLSGAEPGIFLDMAFGSSVFFFE